MVLPLVQKVFNEKGCLYITPDKRAILTQPENDFIRLSANDFDSAEELNNQLLTIIHNISAFFTSKEGEEDAATNKE